MCIYLKLIFTRCLNICWYLFILYPSVPQRLVSVMLVVNSATVYIQLHFNLNWHTYCLDSHANVHSEIPLFTRSRIAIQIGLTTCVRWCRSKNGTIEIRPFILSYCSHIIIRFEEKQVPTPSILASHRIRKIGMLSPVGYRKYVRARYPKFNC